MQPHQNNHSVKFCDDAAPSPTLVPLETDGNFQEVGFYHFELCLANLTFNGSVFHGIYRGSFQVAAHFAAIVTVASFMVEL